MDDVGQYNLCVGESPWRASTALRWTLWRDCDHGTFKCIIHNMQCYSLFHAHHAVHADDRENSIIGILESVAHGRADLQDAARSLEELTSGLNVRYDF